MRYLILFVVCISILNASCDIKQQYIHDCNFSGQSFENYNFSKKTLKNINFGNANLFGAIFNKAKLTNVNFDRANLFGTFFVESILKHVTFNKADISSSDFTGVKLSATNFKTATQVDTIFGKMLIEKDDVIKVKNCKMIIPIKKKIDWYTTMLSLSLDGGNSDEFIIGSLCKWHSGATFKLNNIVNTAKKRKKLTITYNSCKFPVYVTVGSKKTYIKDTYNEFCVRSSPSHSNLDLTSSALKTFECSYQCRTSGFVFYDHIEFSMTVQAYEYYQAESKVESYADKRCDSMIGAETGLRMWDTSVRCNQKY